MRRLVVIVAVSALVAAACGDDPATPAGPVEHPRDADELVVQISHEGIDGLPGSEFEALPMFSLYGDGTAVTLGPQIMIYPPPALPNLLEVRVTDSGVQQVLRTALDAGLHGSDRELEPPAGRNDELQGQVAMVFTVVSNGQRHTTVAHALGPPDQEAGDRAALAAFAQNVTDLRGWLPAGSVGEEQEHVFHALRIGVLPEGERRDTDPGIQPNVQQWPLDDDLATFGTPDAETGVRCGVVESEQLEQLREALAGANQLTLWDSEGTQYHLLLRPLLPDESGC